MNDLCTSFLYIYRRKHPISAITSSEIKNPGLPIFLFNMLLSFPFLHISIFCLWEKRKPWYEISKIYLLSKMYQVTFPNFQARRRLKLLVTKAISKRLTLIIPSQLFNPNSPYLVVEDILSV